MIENCIGVMPIPLGLGVGFKINGKQYQIPMAIEEPSVIAACSAIAKLIREKGSGFRCESTAPIMIAQIQILELRDLKEAEYQLKVNKNQVIEFANLSCKSMVERGGGVEDMRYRLLSEDSIVVELLVNV